MSETFPTPTEADRAALCFHDGVDAVGHVASEGATKVWDGVKDVGSGLKQVFSSVF